MSAGKKKYTLSSIGAWLGCSSTCRWPRHFAVFQPKPRQRRPLHRQSSSISYKDSSVAVAVAEEMDSSDPYYDFRSSMQNVISAYKIYSDQDLMNLFNIFLVLNRADSHGNIFRAFVEMWNRLHPNEAKSSRRRPHGKSPARDY